MTVLDSVTGKTMPCETDLKILIQMGWKPKTMLDIFDVCEKP